MRNIQFANGEFYHVFNRGVDKRQIFMDEDDYQRFYESLYLFNDDNYESPGSSLGRQSLLSRDRIMGYSRDVLVEILSFVMIPNHFHFLLRQSKENGISRFMQNVGKGYAQYFNRKYNRSGALFESKYKAVHIGKDAQFYHLPRYIHLNALDTTQLNWRDGLVEDWRKAEQFLNSFPWSSHHIFMNRRQQLPVIKEDFIWNNFSDTSLYIKYLQEWTGRESHDRIMG